MEDMDLTDLYSTYSKIRENQVSPMNMLKIMLYGYMNVLYSSSWPTGSYYPVNWKHIF